MEDTDNRAQVDKMAKDAIAENNKALKEIAGLQRLIEEIGQKKEDFFEKQGITKEIQELDIAVSDLPSGERKIFDAIQRDFLAKISAKGVNLPVENIKKKSNVGLSMARRGLKI